jgi:dTMP kinase
LPFISVDGIDGSGKTLQVERLVHRLRGEGKTVLQTKEPDGGHLGKEIRAILTRGNRRLTRIEELLLVNAARYDHVRSVIRPALTAGHWVVSDRFLDSTYALQVFGAKNDLSSLFSAITQTVIEETLPDATFILDLPEGEAESRRRSRQTDQIDPAESLRDFAQRREGFRVAARKAPGRCHIVSANRSADEVHDEIWTRTAALL